MHAYAGRKPTVAWESPNADRRWSDKDSLTRKPLRIAYVSYMRWATLAREYADFRRDSVEEALKEAARERSLVKLPKGYCDARSINRSPTLGMLTLYR